MTLKPASSRLPAVKGRRENAAQKTKEADMSIFSRLKKSRQQAKEHNAKLATQEKKEDEVKTPYKHVPKHAAADAIASAPPSWREDDRQKIQEQNRRRSAMAASSQSMNMMPGVPRVGSSLSHVSYPTDQNVTPMVRLPRAYSYTGISPYTSNHSRNTSMPDVGSQFAAYAASTKGKEAVRGSGYDTSRTSPTSSQGLSSPSSSSSVSASANLDSSDANQLLPTPRRVRELQRLYEFSR